MDGSEVQASSALPQYENTDANPLPGADLWGAPGWCAYNSGFTGDLGHLYEETSHSHSFFCVAEDSVHLTHTLSLSGSWRPNSGLEPECEAT